MAGPWVDTHGHLFMLDDPSDVVLGRAADAGVRWIMCPGVDAATSEGARAIAEAHPTQVAWSTGLHPHDAERWPDECDRIAEMASEAAAIGECGLDFYRNLAPRDAQIAAFSDQLALGNEHGLPVIIHCRDAFADVYELLGEADLGSRAVLHCWTGGPRWTKRFRELGVVFSFAGPLTYATGETLRLGAAQAPPDQTMVETDAPYLTPEPLRGATNDPSFVGHTGAALAEVWGTTVDAVAATTTANAERVFGRPGG